MGDAAALEAVLNAVYGTDSDDACSDACSDAFSESFSDAGNDDRGMAWGVRGENKDEGTNEKKRDKIYL